METLEMGIPKGKNSDGSLKGNNCWNFEEPGSKGIIVYKSFATPAEVRREICRIQVQFDTGMSSSTPPKPKEPIPKANPTQNNQSRSTTVSAKRRNTFLLRFGRPQ